MDDSEVIAEVDRRRLCASCGKLIEGVDGDCGCDAVNASITVTCAKPKRESRPHARATADHLRHSPRRRRPRQIRARQPRKTTESRPQDRQRMELRPRHQLLRMHPHIPQPTNPRTTDPQRSHKNTPNRTVPCLARSMEFQHIALSADALSHREVVRSRVQRC